MSCTIRNSSQRRHFPGIGLAALLLISAGCGSNSSGDLAAVLAGENGIDDVLPGGIESRGDLETPILNDDSTFGTPGAVKYTDCDGEVPCAWVSADRGLKFTVENVHTGAVSGKLELRYTLQTTRDTSLRWLSTGGAVDSEAQNYVGLEAVIDSTGEDIADNRKIDLLAGVVTSITQNFQQSPAHSTRSISRLTVNLLEGGIKHGIGFVNLPLDADTGKEIDCRNRTPCNWTAENEEFEVNLISADGLSIGGRLTVLYQVEVFEDLVLKSDTGSIAIGNDGANYKPKLHSLGETLDYRAFETDLFAGTLVSGSQTYFRHIKRSATRLKKLTLNLSQVGVSVADSPVFKNVPVN